MKSILFNIRAYNDLDHFSPIIYKIIVKEEFRPILYMANDFNWKHDYRIEYLKSSGLNPEDILIDDSLTFNNKKKTSGLSLFAKLGNFITGRARKVKPGIFDKIRHFFFLNVKEEIGFLQSNRVVACVFEWSTPYSNGNKLYKFFLACKALGCTTLSLPHGCNIYTFPMVTSGHLSLAGSGRNIDYPDQRNQFDYYILQGKVRRDICVRLGYDPIKTQAWGSVRFCPDWHEILLKISGQFNPCRNNPDLFKVVFMDHQLDYRIEQDLITELLIDIVNIENVFLVYKGSTREGRGTSFLKYVQDKSLESRVYLADSTDNSVAIIEWSDCVINYGSSIGIEALLQDKPLIVPNYLHHNETLYDLLEAGLICTSSSEVVNKIELLKRNRGDIVLKYAKGKNDLLKDVVYGGSEAFDVLELYYSLITSKRLNY